MMATNRSASLIINKVDNDCYKNEISYNISNIKLIFWVLFRYDLRPVFATQNDFFVLKHVKILIASFSLIHF